MNFNLSQYLLATYFILSSCVNSDLKLPLGVLSIGKPIIHHDVITEIQFCLYKNLLSSLNIFQEKNIYIWCFTTWRYAPHYPINFIEILFTRGLHTCLEFENEIPVSTSRCHICEITWSRFVLKEIITYASACLPCTTFTIYLFIFISTETSKIPLKQNRYRQILSFRNIQNPPKSFH